MKRLLKRVITLVLTVVTLFSLISPAVINASAALATPVKGAKQSNYRKWAQDDPRWYNVKLNNCDETTFWHVGCLVISYTKLLIQAGVKEETFLPTDMNTWMKNNKGFAGSKDPNAVPEKLANISSSITWGGQVKLSGTNDQKKTKIMQAIKDGYYILVCRTKKNSDGSNNTHWVVVDNATSLDIGYPVIWDTAKKIPKNKPDNINVDLMDRYGKYVNRMILYKVSKSKYTVKYNANGGKGSMADTTVTYGEATQLQANTFTKSGYTFGGWYVYRNSDKKWCYTDSNGNLQWYAAGSQPSGWVKYTYKDKAYTAHSSSKDKDIIYLYAAWKKAYTIKYEANGGKGSMANTVVTYGVSTKLRTNTFTKSGYTFGGWNIYRTSDKKWYYRNASGTGKWCKKGLQPIGYSLAVYKDGTTVSKLSSKAGDTIKLYAVWNKAYTVKYYPNGGEGSMSSTTVTYGVDTKISPNTFTRSGYTFGGWYVYRTSDNKWYYRNASGTGKWCKKGLQPVGYSLAVYKDATTVAKTSSKAGDTIKLYAKWNKAYTVKYNANGGEGSMADTVVTYGVSTELRSNTFTRADHIFMGWNIHRASDNKWYYRNASGTGKWCVKDQQPSGYSLAVYQNGTTVSKLTSTAGDTVTLYAVWFKTIIPSTLAINNSFLPADKMSSSASFTISGVITSNSNIKSVTAKVVKADSTVAFSATATPNAKTYSLYNLDSKMSFSKLGAGSYTLIVTATDSMGTKTLVNKSFTCTKTSITTSGMVYPSGTLTKGNTFCVKGTVKSSNKISQVVASVYSVDGVKQFSASAKPNATSYSIYNLDKYMTFRKLAAGKYIYRVCVTDGNGVSKYVISKSFTVA